MMIVFLVKSFCRLLSVSLIVWCLLSFSSLPFTLSSASSLSFCALYCPAPFEVHTINVGTLCLGASSVLLIGIPDQSRLLALASFSCVVLLGIRCRRVHYSPPGPVHSFRRCCFCEFLLDVVFMWAPAACRSRVLFGRFHTSLT